jgi:hypothetical protein
VCSLCAVLGRSDHWTDAAGRPEFERLGRKVTRRAERERRVDLLNVILASQGLRVLDWGGNSFVIEDRAGKSENAYSLNAIWSAADRLGHRPIDPLDEEILANVQAALEKAQ